MNPGDGYNILAYNLERTKICKRFNGFGVNCVLVKYCVPRCEGLEKHTPPLQDFQHAIAYTCPHAAKWKLNPNKIGVIGFSADAHLSAMASTAYNEPVYWLNDRTIAACSGYKKIKRRLSQAFVFRNLFAI